MSVVESVKDWVRIDNRIKELNEEVKSLRERRKENEQSIKVWAEPLMQQGQKPTININDGKLRFVETKQLAPLSLKFIEEQLNSYFGGSKQQLIEEIMQKIKDNREYKIVQEVKRVYNKAE